MNSTIVIIEVSQENRVCSKCCSRGHNSNETICPFYASNIPHQYRNKCSRCNQPGHNRNSRICSLKDRFPDYRYGRRSQVQVQAPLPQARPLPLPQARPEVQAHALPQTRPQRARPLPQQQAPQPAPQQEHTNNNPLEANDSNIQLFFNKINELRSCVARLCHCIGSNSTGIENSIPAFNPNELFNQISRRFMVQLSHLTDSLTHTLWNNTFTTSRDSINDLTWIDGTFDGLCMELSHYISALYPTIIMYSQIDNIIGNAPLYNAAALKLKRCLELSITMKPNTEPIIDCSICYENKEFNTFCEFGCNHQLCVNCVCALIKSRSDNIHKPVKCPLCRSNITTVKCHNETQYNSIHAVL
jgi:hypothetical protein